MTATRRRKLDNVLPTMDKHGVEDIVRNLSSGESEGDRREREIRSSQRPLTNEFSADTYGASRRPGMEDAARAVAAPPSDQGLRGERINNEGERKGPPTAMLRGARQVAARTSVSPKVPPVPARNKGVEEAINEGAANLSNEIAQRNARVKARRRRID